jgi:PAS domain S-box-containing protein
LAFLAVCLGVFLVETLLMWFLQPLFPFGERIEAFIDATTLLAVMAPLLYFLFVRPMSSIIRQKTQAEQALQVVCEDLEARVKVRTAELEASNASLQEEIRQRVRTLARLQIQGKLLDAVQQAVLATGIEGTIIYWNQYAEEVFGWSSEEARGRILGDLDLFPPEVLTEDLSDPSTARAWDGEVVAKRRGGLTFPAYLTCSPMWKPDCTIGGFVFTFLDITDRKEAEEAIRYSEERYSTVVENSPTGIFIFQDEKIVFANRRFFEMLDWAPEDLDSLRPAEILHPEDWPVVREIWRQRFAGEESVKDQEYRILTPRGGVRWISGRSTLIRINGQKALLGNVQDVTERQEAVQALRDSREMLQRLSASQIEAQENERKRVARELHDSLGQSLSAIKFIVERALENGSSGSPAALRSVVPVIQSTMEEVRRISMALRPSTLDDLGLLMTISWFTREFQVTYPDIQVDKALEVQEAQIPETLKINIFRILQEAMNNAAKHSQTERLLISLKWNQGCLELRIQDEGIGFDPTQQSQADVRGGLGLDSMRERALLFGGICTITSSPRKGTTVTARWTVEEGVLADKG